MNKSEENNMYTYSVIYSIYEEYEVLSVFDNKEDAEEFLFSYLKFLGDEGNPANHSIVRQEIVSKNPQFDIVYRQSFTNDIPGQGFYHSSHFCVNGKGISFWFDLDENAVELAIAFPGELFFSEGKIVNGHLFFNAYTIDEKAFQKIKSGEISLPKS